MSENKPTPNEMSDEDFAGLVLRHLEDSLDEQGTSALYAEMLRDVSRRRQFVSLHLRSVTLSELLRPQLFDDPENSAPATLDDAQIMPAMSLTASAEGSDSGVIPDAASHASDEPDSILKIAGRLDSSSRWFHWAHPSRLGMGIAASLLLASAITLFLFLHPHAEPIAMGPTLDAVWADPGSIPAPGTLVKTGVAQTLESGCAELTASNGLMVVIQGPATFTIEKPGVISLASGRLTASVPKPARGFTINTPVSRIVDLGTEFGVSVNGSGETDVQTFRGTVSLTSSTSPPSAPASLITAGLARRVSSSGDVTQIPADTTAFVRPQQFDDWKAMPNGTSYERWKAYSERLRSDPDLVAYYTFDKSESDPERLINLAASGPALNGFLRGTDRIHERPVWTTGRWPEKGALAFNPNSHERVEIESPIGGPLDFSRDAQTAVPFTICMWLRAEQQHPVHSSIFLKGGGSDQFGLELIADGSIEGSVGRIVVGDRRSPASKITNKWQLVSLNYDPDHGNLALYVNGVQVAQNPNASRTLPHSEWPLAIGNREFRVKVASHLPPMAGQIDEVAVFRRALSEEQVKEMYEAEKPD